MTTDRRHVSVLFGSVVRLLFLVSLSLCSACGENTTSGDAGGGAIPTSTPTPTQMPTSPITAPPTPVPTTTVRPTPTPTIRPTPTPTSVGDAPQARNVCVSTPANTVRRGQMSASGQGLAYEVIDLPHKGSLVSDANGNYTYTPSTGVLGMDQFRFRVRDASGRQSIGTVSLFIDSRLRIMPLGDSITDGIVDAAGASPAVSARVGYRRRLFKLLEELSSGYGVNFHGGGDGGYDANPPIGDDDHEGHPGYCDGPGATSACVGRNVADQIIPWLNVQPVDIVLVHVGTNDFEPNNPNDVRLLLDNIESWAAAHYPVVVFLARTIPTVDGSLDVEMYNNNVDTVAQSRPHVRVVRVNQQTGAGLQLTPNTANPSMMGDNLHPNQTGYDRMADKWFADMQASGVLPKCQ